MQRNNKNICHKMTFHKAMLRTVIISVAAQWKTSMCSSDFIAEQQMALGSNLVFASNLES